MTVPWVARTPLGSYLADRYLGNRPANGKHTFSAFLSDAVLFADETDAVRATEEFEHVVNVRWYVVDYAQEAMCPGS